MACGTTARVPSARNPEIEPEEDVLEVITRWVSSSIERDRTGGLTSAGRGDKITALPGIQHGNPVMAVKYSPIHPHHITPFGWGYGKWPVDVEAIDLLWYEFVFRYSRWDTSTLARTGPVIEDSDGKVHCHLPGQQPPCRWDRENHHP